MSTERVSIVMPAYNVAPFIGAALLSALRQDYPSMEIIVVDDGSSDDTVSRIEEVAAVHGTEARPVRLLRRDHTGASAARNAGIEAATGQYIAFLDADDLWDPPLLTLLVSKLERSPEIDLVFPMFRFIDEEGRRLRGTSSYRKERYSAEDLLVRNPISSATGVLVRRSAIAQAGPFDTDLRSCVDLDLWVRIGWLRSRNIAAMDAVLVSYRQRRGQITGEWRRMETGWLAVMEKAEHYRRSPAPKNRQAARSSRSVYWSIIAYNGGHYREARSLIWRAWRLAPLRRTIDPLALRRTAIAFASLLPDAFHRALVPSAPRRSTETPAKALRTPS